MESESDGIMGKNRGRKYCDTLPLNLKVVYCISPPGRGTRNKKNSFLGQLIDRFLVRRDLKSSDISYFCITVFKKRMWLIDCSQHFNLFWMIVCPGVETAEAKIYIIIIITFYCILDLPFQKNLSPCSVSLHGVKFVELNIWISPRKRIFKRHHINLFIRGSVGLLIN